MSSARIRRYLRHGMLPQLAVFEASARLGSFTRAAEELHLAQPTVSTQMKKLTATVGLPLFEQIGKKIHLTPAGHALCEGARELITVQQGTVKVTSDGEHTALNRGDSAHYPADVPHAIKNGGSEDAIVFLVVTVRLILFPLFVKQIKSQRAMQELQPEIAKLRKQYGSDRQGMSQAMMALQKERGVNPLAGSMTLGR